MVWLLIYDLLIRLCNKLTKMSASGKERIMCKFFLVFQVLNYFDDKDESFPRSDK